MNREFIMHVCRSACICARRGKMDNIAITAGRGSGGSGGQKIKRNLEAVSPFYFTMTRVNKSQICFVGFAPHALRSSTSGRIPLRPNRGDVEEVILYACCLYAELETKTNEDRAQ